MINNNLSKENNINNKMMINNSKTNINNNINQKLNNFLIMKDYQDKYLMI